MIPTRFLHIPSRGDMVARLAASNSPVVGMPAGPEKFNSSPSVMILHQATPSPVVLIAIFPSVFSPSRKMVQVLNGTISRLLPSNAPHPQPPSATRSSHKVTPTGLAGISTLVWRLLFCDNFKVSLPYLMGYFPLYLGQRQL